MKVYALMEMAFDNDGNLDRARDLWVVDESVPLLPVESLKERVEKAHPKAIYLQVEI